MISNFAITAIVCMIALYACAVFFGYMRARETMNADKPSAVMWEMLERLYIGVFCVVFLCSIVHSSFDTVFWYLQEILTKLEELPHG